MTFRATKQIATSRNRFVGLTALFAASLAFAPTADAACTRDMIETCTLTDPSATERLLLAALEEEDDAAILFDLGYYYLNAPGQFRDAVKGRWYLRRAADRGYEPAIASLDELNNPPPAEPAEEKDPSVIVAYAPAEPIPDDPDSSLEGVQLTIDDILVIAYEAGFRTEEQLLPALATAIAESSLWTAARNWKPELGYRPVFEPVLVIGPEGAWRDGQQMHADRGLWQLSSRAWPQFGDHITDDPMRAARATFIVSEGGTDFFAWDSFLGGRAQLHYDRSVHGWPPLRPIVQEFLASILAETPYWERI